MLPIAKDLTLPADADTQTFAFIGRKGSGKTYGAGKLVELMHEHGVQVVILDCVGNWWGLRIAADGKGDGLDIPILGGLRGDVPLEATGGALVADVVVDSGRSLILDISQFNKADRQRFATAFGERLWQRRKGEDAPIPMHLVIEESQMIVPEHNNRDTSTAHMVGIYTDIVRLGRNYGIGVTMITQRPQSVSKEVLNQTECLLVFQVNGAHERKALKDWMVHQDIDTGLLRELPSLQPGDCFVWSPQWLTVLKKIHIAPKRTFDSTRTPKAGERKRGRRALKAIDLDELKSKMAATIERAKADDPKALRAEIKRLERELAAKPMAVAPPENPVKAEHLRLMAESLDDLGVVRERVEALTAEVGTLATLVKGAQSALVDVRGHIEAPRSNSQRIPTATAAAVTPLARRALEGQGATLPVGERAILIAAAQFDGVTKQELTVLTGYKRSSRDAYVSRLVQRDFATVRDGKVLVTIAGQAALGDDYEPLPTGDDLLQHWKSRLPEGEAKILRLLERHWPTRLSGDEISDCTDYKRSSRNAYLSRMRAKRLLDEDRNGVRLSLLLVDEQRHRLAD